MVTQKERPGETVCMLAWNMRTRRGLYKPYKVNKDSHPHPLSLSLYLSKNDEERSFLKGMKVDKKFDLNPMTLKMNIETIMCLTRVEALYQEIRRVKKTLKSDAQKGFGFPRKKQFSLTPTTRHI